MSYDKDPVFLLYTRIILIPHILRHSNGGIKGLLHRAIPKEMFDPNGHAMDTTYLDADIRIVRLTGPSHEGCRNIFMRQGSLIVNPMSSD